MLSDHMREPGATADQLEVMERYVAARPESYTGRVMLHALRHFAGFHRLWDPARPGPGLAPLCLAFALDETAVSVEFRRDPAGAIAPTEAFAAAHRAAERRYRADEGDVEAALLHAMLKVAPGADSGHSACLAGLDRAVAIGQGAPAGSLARRLLPRLLSLRGATRCFRGEAGLGLGDFEQCRGLLRGDGGASLAPHALDGLPSELRGRLRAVELREVGLDAGRATLLLRQRSPAQARAAAEGIRAFIDHVPSDTHYFVNAHYELICALSPGIYREPGAVRALIARADAAMGDHLPIFSPVSEEAFPKMAQAKALLRARDLAEAARGTGTAGRGRARRGAGEPGDDSEAPGRGGGGARTREGDSEGDVIRPHDGRPNLLGDPDEDRCGSGRGQASGCWRCGSKDAAGGLKVCKGCATARYCCRACQVGDWARHKPVCVQISGATGAGSGSP